MLTPNEKKILKYLLVNFNRDRSINEVAKDCQLSPNGAYKILRKLEREGVLTQKTIANIKAFKVSCPTLKARRIIELAFMEPIKGRVEQRYKDLLPLQNVVRICIVFGSYLTEKKNPEDLDTLMVMEKTNFSTYKKALQEVQEIVPVKIHDILQTKQDFLTNLRQDNKVIKQALQWGIVLWGQEKLIEVLSDVCP
ncbi:MAG: winged helix-turn-helix domain-containing protein [Nanoarchaeota archaeon]